jgi:hypothetical protein
MFPVFITVHNEDQLKAVMTALGHLDLRDAQQAAQQANQQQVAPKAEPQPVKVGYQDAAKAIVDLTRVKGRDAAVAVLAKFGAARLSDVDEKHYADVVKACEEAING